MPVIKFDLTNSESESHPDKKRYDQTRDSGANIGCLQITPSFSDIPERSKGGSMMEIPNYRADSRPHRHPVTFRNGAYFTQSSSRSQFYVLPKGIKHFCPSVSALNL